MGIALTEAKRRHKGGCVVFQREMRQHAMSTLRLQTELRQAVDRDEFAVFYQPIVNLETLVITGFEALVRWRHPSRGVVFPDEFIPLAEETNLILPIGLRALERACARLARWNAAYPDDLAPHRQRQPLPRSRSPLPASSTPCKGSSRPLASRPLS